MPLQTRAGFDIIPRDRVKSPTMKIENGGASRIIKVENFTGSLSTRSLYIYLPSGYDEEMGRHYPILYMHDGQNCFDAYADDSYAGSWGADQVADQLILSGKMQPCIIVGVSNGGRRRLVEYLPPYAKYMPESNGLEEPPHIHGQADRTVAFYRDEVARYVQAHYRVRTGRAHTAICGSSLGGLFTAYIAWEYPEFARHHAVMSPSFWITAIHPEQPHSRHETIERFRKDPPRDIRLWLDSGSITDHGSDGMVLTQEARDALLANGYAEGDNFRYYLHNGAIHHESSWRERLPLVFQFLFPPQPEHP